MPAKTTILVISGPTGSGKSSLGVTLAKALNGEVINLDSVQLYSDLQIGANKISLEEMQGVPHHLLGVIAAHQQVNASIFIELAHEKIAELSQRNKLAILVGGSSMYLTLLLHGLADLPVADQKLRLELSQLSNSELHNRLSQVDPEAANRIHLNDRLRLERALEIQLNTNQSQTSALARHAYRDLLFNALVLIPTWERATLKKRIEERTKSMLQQGLINETRQIINRFGRDAPALSAIGYRECLEEIEGNGTAGQLATLISNHTYQFAKRQLTFFRNEPAKRGWRVEPDEQDEAAETLALSHKGEKTQSVYRWNEQTLINQVATRLSELSELDGAVRLSWIAAECLVQNVLI